MNFWGIAFFLTKLIESEFVSLLHLQKLKIKNQEKENYNILIVGLSIRATMIYNNGKVTFISVACWLV